MAKLRATWNTLEKTMSHLCAGVEMKGESNVLVLPFKVLPIIIYLNYLYRADFDFCANSPPSDGFFYASHSKIEIKHSAEGIFGLFIIDILTYRFNIVPNIKI